MTSQELKPRALSVDEAARYLGLGKRTLYYLAESKKVRLLKVGRKTIVLLDDLDAYLDSLAQKVA